MKIWMKKVVDNAHAMTGEDRFVIFFLITFFVGVWYAIPMVNTITDVWSFGGGVLRALEAHTLLPGKDIAYGTLTFYQNYALMVIALGLGYIALGFDVEALKTLLIFNPSYTLVVSRIASAFTAAVLLAVVYRFLRRYVPSASWRITLILLAFGNVLTAILTRSGKMWMLSIGLGVVSFIYLYRALAEETAGRPGKLATISIITAFLATANFAFAGIFLVTVPILFYAFPRTYDTLKRLSIVVISGISIFFALFALNAANTVAQTYGFIAQFFDSALGTVTQVRKNLTFWESFRINARQTVESFPLLLFALGPAVFSGIRDRTLAALATLYIAIYIIAVSFIFRADDGLALNIRHSFPIGFFLMFLLAAFRPPPRSISIVLSVVGFALYVYTLVLLSIPTTYNMTYNFVLERYSDVPMRIEERIFELTLPMNKMSYQLFESSACGSTCQHMRLSNSDIAFRPIVTTGESDPVMTANLPPPDLVVVERAIGGCTPIARFGNDVSDNEVFDIDINLGRMLLPSFYRLERLGKNIYIYDTKSCNVSNQIISPPL